MARANWFDENEGRTFPFLENLQEVLEVSTSALFINLPNSAIVDFGSTMGVLSYYEEGTHVIYLSRIVREAGAFIFDFAATAPGLVGQILRFRRPVGTREFVTEYSDVESINPDVSASNSTVCPADDSLWEGYLVTGNLLELETVLHSDGMELTGDATEAIVEPALTQSLVDSMLRTVNLANGDRTRVTNPVGCIQPVLPFQQDSIYVNQECILGDICWKAGYNCNIVQSVVDNSITIGAAVGAGEGEPCEEVALFDGETPAGGSNLLTGGPTCGEVIRSINGVGGRVFDVQGGNGVDVTADPANHRLEINMNMNNLAVCFDDADPDDTGCSVPEVSTTLCGDAP